VSIGNQHRIRGFHHNQVAYAGNGEQSRFTAQVAALAVFGQHVAKKHIAMRSSCSEICHSVDQAPTSLQPQLSGTTAPRSVCSMTA
jgi:hypothetical protein